MKIEHFTGNEAVRNREDKTRKDSVEKDQNFAKLLESEQNVKPETTQRPDAYLTAMYPLNSILSTNMFLDSPSDTQPALEAMEQTLGSLDRLERCLSDDKTTPQRMHQAFQDLSETIPELRQQLDNLPEDHPLRQIGEELQVLSYVETAKWNRGDYL